MKLSSIISNAATLALGYSAAASPVKPVLSRQDGYHGPVTDDLLANMKFISQYAGSAYCNGKNTPDKAVSCTSEVCPLVTANNATTVTSFTGVTTDQEGLIATDPAKKLIVLAFRGSASTRNFLTDVRFVQQFVPGLCPNCLVHAGFLAAWNEVKGTVTPALQKAAASHPDYRIVLTGHSLGGALAILSGSYLRKSGMTLDVYSYGSPRVGNPAFASFATSQSPSSGTSYRVTHLDDPVPRVPPLFFDFRHTSPEYWLSGGRTTSNEVKKEDVKVCLGAANTMCNGGGKGFNVDAHSHYFGAIGACGANGTVWRREVSDAELMAKLDAWADKDREFAKGLEGNGTEVDKTGKKTG